MQVRASILITSLYKESTLCSVVHEEVREKTSGTPGRWGDVVKDMRTCSAAQTSAPNVRSGQLQIMREDSKGLRRPW